jgi:hypothetical protein
MKASEFYLGIGMLMVYAEVGFNSTFGEFGGWVISAVMLLGALRAKHDGR